MNEYVELDGFKYEALVCRPKDYHPVTVSHHLDGSHGATFGPSVAIEWTITFICRNTPLEGYGDLDDLRASYAQVDYLAFTDLAGDEHTVVFADALDITSVSPIEDDVDNWYKVATILIKVA
jgi:hypothetical protein